MATVLKSAQASWCLGTGPGTCNLNIEGGPQLSTSGYGYQYLPVWQRINIFDNACNLIGYINSPMKGVSIDSQLPYTIVITNMQNDNEHFGFCYAGECYDSGFTCQTSDQNGNTAIECLRAFACGDELDRTAKQHRSFQEIEGGFG